MPDYDSYFEVTYNDQADITYREYYDFVCDQKHVGDALPYRFGSYQIFRADAKKYDFQVNLFVNATSNESIPYFQQYIFDAILKTVDPEISLTTTTAPFPVFAVLRSREASGQSVNFCVIMSIALAIIPTCIIGVIIKEREQKLKHLQVVSGVSLTAYWASNLISDVLQAYIPIIIILILNAIFDLKYEAVW